MTAAVAGSAAYSQLKTTSSAVNGLPSCQCTFFLRFHTTQVPSLASAAVVHARDLGGEHREQVAVRVVGGQRLVEDARGVLVLGPGGEVRIEQRRGLPPEHLQRPTPAALGGREGRRPPWAARPRRRRPSICAAIGAVRPSPTMICTKRRRVRRPALTSRMRLSDRSARPWLQALLSIVAASSQCLDHRLVIGNALPRAVERRAVIDRHAQERQPHRDVDAREARPFLGRLVVLETECFHGDVALVVIHRDDDIKLTAAGAGEERVGGQGTGHVEAFGARGLDRGDDLAALLVAEESVLAGVRVEARPPRCDRAAARDPAACAGPDGSCGARGRG